MHYFAYGSNMHHEQMKERCPGSRFIKRAFLEEHKFVYDGFSSSRRGAVANIIHTGNEKDIVWGGIFEINKDDLFTLDCYEGYPDYYNRKEIIVKDANRNIYKAIAYYREDKIIGSPSQFYRYIVIQGAKDCGLPGEYIKSCL